MSAPHARAGARDARRATPREMTVASASPPPPTPTTIFAGGQGGAVSRPPAFARIPHSEISISLR